jgi:hypothetical protein
MLSVTSTNSLCNAQEPAKLPSCTPPMANRPQEYDDLERDENLNFNTLWKFHR